MDLLSFQVKDVISLIFDYIQNIKDINNLLLVNKGYNKLTHEKIKIIGNGNGNENENSNIEVKNYIPFYGWFKKFENVQQLHIPLKIVDIYFFKRAEHVSSIKYVKEMTHYSYIHNDDELLIQYFISYLLEKKTYNIIHVHLINKGKKLPTLIFRKNILYIHCKMNTDITTKSSKIFENVDFAFDRLLNNNFYTKLLLLCMALKEKFGITTHLMEHVLVNYKHICMSIETERTFDTYSFTNDENINRFDQINSMDNNEVHSLKIKFSKKNQNPNIKKYYEGIANEFSNSINTQRNSFLLRSSNTLKIMKVPVYPNDLQLLKKYFPNLEKVVVYVKDPTETIDLTLFPKIVKYDSINNNFIKLNY